MTFGHFTSWRADDRGYYTGVESAMAAAAMCTLPYFLQGMVALAGAQPLLKQFDVSAKVALKAPLDRNVKKPLVLEGFSMRARADFQHFWMRKWCVFICFLDIAS